MAQTKICDSDRGFRRLRARELAKINLEFVALIRAFEEALFGYDWDLSNLSEVPVFQKYNEVWLKYCQHHQSTAGAKVLTPDPNAFHRYAIDQSVEGSGPLEFALTQNSDTNEKTTGAG